jgi:hypothetical protein
MTRPRRAPSARARAFAVAGAALVVALVAGCSSTASNTTAPTTVAPTTTAPASTSTTQPGHDAVVFVSVGGNIDAYASQPPFDRQRVVAAGTAADGSEPHGQICFLPDGSRRFLVAESRPAHDGAPASAGFGVYQLTGNDVGTYRVARLGGVSTPIPASAGTPTTYGCAFLPDGRLFTTVVGAGSGTATGELVEWFPPFTAARATHCTIATGLASPGGLAADPSGAIDVAVSRAPGAGVWHFAGAYPAGAAACGALTPSTTAPGAPAGPATVASGIKATLLVAAGTHGLDAPAAVALTPGGKGLLVTSPPDGAIDQFDVAGHFVSSLLTPAAGEQLGATPRAAGTPFGVAVNADGAVFYTDPGLVKAPDGTIAPGIRLGSLRRIVVTNGTAAAPQIVNRQLAAPDGLGIFDPTDASGGSASIA